jgi:hypothetical protein
MVGKCNSAALPFLRSEAWDRTYALISHSLHPGLLHHRAEMFKIMICLPVLTTSLRRREQTKTLAYSSIGYPIIHCAISWLRGLDLGITSHGYQCSICTLLHNPRKIFKLSLGKQTRLSIRSLLVTVKFQDSGQSAASLRASCLL